MFSRSLWGTRRPADQGGRSQRPPLFVFIDVFPVFKLRPYSALGLVNAAGAPSAAARASQHGQRRERRTGRKTLPDSRAACPDGRSERRPRAASGSIRRVRAGTFGLSIPRFYGALHFQFGTAVSF